VLCSCSCAWYSGKYLLYGAGQVGFFHCVAFHISGLWLAQYLHYDQAALIGNGCWSCVCKSLFAQQTGGEQLSHVDNKAVSLLSQQLSRVDSRVDTKDVGELWLQNFCQTSHISLHQHHKATTTMLYHYHTKL
jgi:hypothetical protein